MAAALLLHSFFLGDLIRWLGGDYTHDPTNMAPIKAAVAGIRGPKPPCLLYPPAAADDLPRAPLRRPSSTHQRT